MTLKFTIPGPPHAKARHRTAPLNRCQKCGKTSMGQYSQCKYCGGGLTFVSNIPYADSTTAKYENLVAYCASQAMKEQSVERKMVGGISIAVNFFMPASQTRACKQMSIPGGCTKKNCKKLHTGEPHTQRPDLDNLIKSMDGLNGVVFGDDCLVYAISASKMWSHDPHTEVEVIL